MLVFARGLMNGGDSSWLDRHNGISGDRRPNDADAAMAHRLGESLTSKEESVFGAGML
jgi:hypothetical protein